MPTAPQITDLARKYAEEMCAHMEDSFEKDQAIHDNELTFQMAVNHLSRHYSLVEKSKVREAYKDAQKDQYNSEGDFALTLAGRNRSAVLVELFPEIAKEVENAR